MCNSYAVVGEEKGEEGREGEREEENDLQGAWKSIKS